jgi:hypothetical protein
MGSLGVDGLYESLKGKDNRATATCIYAYCSNEDDKVHSLLVKQKVILNLLEVTDLLDGIAFSAKKIMRRLSQICRLVKRIKCLLDLKLYKNL